MTSTITSRRAAALGALAAVGLAAAAPAAAQAQTVALDSGATTLRLDASAARALSGLGVSVAPIAPARAGSAGIAFPITGGRIDPASGAGRVDHSGGLRLRGGGTTVRLTSPRITITRSIQTLSTVVGGGRVHTFRLDLSRAEVARDGLGTEVTGVIVRLTQKGATALNRAFGTRALKSGLRLGTASVSATPAQLAFAGGQTELALDPGAAAALNSLGITAAPTQAATVTDAGTIAFPITRGAVDLATLAGQIRHDGGILLSRGSTRIEVADYVIETAPAPKLTAGSALGRIDLLSLDLSNLTREVSGRSVMLGGVQARLTATAAKALNDTFGTTAFTEGLLLGTATVRGQAR